MDDKEPREPEDGELAVDNPVLQLALLVWTLGIFAIAIVLAYKGYMLWGLLVLVGGLLIALFAFRQAIVELIQWLRQRSKSTREQ